jgi:hypothetical protein
VLSTCLTGEVLVESSPPQKLEKKLQDSTFHIQVVDLKYVRIDDLITEMVNISRPFDQSIHLLLISWHKSSKHTIQFDSSWIGWWLKVVICVKV